MEIPIARSIVFPRSGTCVPMPLATTHYRARLPNLPHVGFSLAPGALSDPAELAWAAPSPDPCPLCHRAQRLRPVQSPIDSPAIGSVPATAVRGRTSAAPSTASFPPICPTTLALPPPSKPPARASGLSPAPYRTSRIALAQTLPDTKRATR